MKRINGEGEIVPTWIKHLFGHYYTNKNKNSSQKKYILWVTNYDGEGYGSKWYGWSENLTFSYKEALKKKKRIKDKFHDVQIVEY